MQSQVNRALDGAIIPTFFYYVVPSIVALLSISTANLVDGIFIGKYVGSDGLAVINLLLPYFTLCFSLAFMMAIGGSVVTAKALGGKEDKTASNVFSQVLLVGLGFVICLLLFVLCFDHLIYLALGIPNELQYLAREYLTIFALAQIPQLTAVLLYYLIRTDGYPVLGTTALVTGALSNIILDILFVGYLDWGMAGAAWATLVAQCIQLVILLRYFTLANTKLKLTLTPTQWGGFPRTIWNGFSEFINEISAGVVIFIVNWLMISQVGVAGVAAMSVVNYLMFFCLMTFYGIADAIPALVGQNYGAGKLTRIRQFMICAGSVITLLSALLVITLLTSSKSLIGLFIDIEAEQQTLILAQSFIAVIWPLFVVNGLNLLMSLYLTAMHLPTPSALVALSRSLILPVIFLLSFAWWQPQWSFLIALPLAEYLTFGLAVYFCWRFRPAKMI